MDPEYDKLKIMLALTFPHAETSSNTYLSGLHHFYLRLFRSHFKTIFYDDSRKKAWSFLIIFIEARSNTPFEQTVTALGHVQEVIMWVY